jgi:hypothetical protein
MHNGNASQYTIEGKILNLDGCHDVILHSAKKKKVTKVAKKFQDLTLNGTNDSSSSKFYTDAMLILLRAEN